MAVLLSSTMGKSYTFALPTTTLGLAHWEEGPPTSVPPSALASTVGSLRRSYPRHPGARDRSVVVLLCRKGYLALGGKKVRDRRRPLSVVVAGTFSSPLARGALSGHVSVVVPVAVPMVLPVRKKSLENGAWEHRSKPRFTGSIVSPSGRSLLRCTCAREIRIGRTWRVLVRCDSVTLCGGGVRCTLWCRIPRCDRTLWRLYGVPSSGTVGFPLLALLAWVDTHPAMSALATYAAPSVMV